MARRERVRIRVICGAELSHEMVGSVSQAELELIAHGPGSTPFRLLHAAPRVAIASDAHGPERMPALRMALDALTGSGERDPVGLVSSALQAMLRYGLRARPEALAA